MDDDAGVVFADIVVAADAGGVPVTIAHSAVLAAMSETDHPQGVLAVCALLANDDLDAVAAARGPLVVLDAVSDPGNVGTIIRTADAVGAAAVVLTPGCADVHNGKVVRSTAGSLFHLPVLPEVPMSTVLAAARAQHRGVAAATGDGEVDLFAAADAGRVDLRTCWVIGSEAHGVSAQARAEADHRVRIPMSGGAESLNAAVAMAVAMYVTAHAAHGSGDSNCGTPG